jgi:hypothetical protein
MHMMKRLACRLNRSIALGVRIRLVVNQFGLNIPETIISFEGMNLYRTVVHRFARTGWRWKRHTRLGGQLTRCNKD